MRYVTLRNPGHEYRTDLDRVFNEFWALPNLSAQNWRPPADIHEEEDHYTLALEVPGLKREDIQIEVVDDQVSVSGEKKEPEIGSAGTLYSERRYGKFARSFTLPSHVDTTKIEAHYLDGVLRVRVPKAENAKPRQVKIQ